MDVNLLIVLATCISIVTLFMMLLYSVKLDKKIKFNFFKNTKYQRLSFFVTLGIFLFLIQIVLFEVAVDGFYYHVGAITFFLLLFREGVQKE